MPLITPDYSEQWEGYTKEGDVIGAKPVATPSVSEESAPTAPSAGRLSVADVREILGSSAKAEAARPNESGMLSANQVREMLNAPDSGMGASTKTPVQTKPQVAPTRFVQAGRPTAPTKERTLGSALSEAGENLFPSVGEALKATGHALAPWNWGETLGNLKSLAQGAVSKTTGMTAGQTPEEQAHNEALVNGLVEHYKNTYGDKQKLYEAIAKDPASIMMDMSTLLTGGSSLIAKGAGTASKVGKLASTVGKAAELLDPVTGTVKAGTTLVKGATAPIRAAAAGTSGLSMDMQKIIREAATTNDPALKEAYNSFASGKGDPVEFLQSAQDAIRKLEKEQIDKFKSSKSNLFNNRIDFSKINSDIQEIQKELNLGSPTGFSKAKEAVDEADDMIQNLINDTSRHNLENVDVLKGQIYDLKNKFAGNSKATSYLDKIYHSISDTLSSPALGGAKEYGDLMRSSQSGMKYISDAERLLGAGNKTAATNALMKALKNTKGYGAKTMMEDISRIDPKIKYMLAGAAANPSHGGLLRNLSDLAVFGGITALGHPAALIGLAGASPRIVAGANYYGAKGSELAKTAARPSYYAGRLDELGNAAGQQVNASPEDVDAMVRTIIGEAGGEPVEGQAAVGHVIMNRLKKGGFGGENIKDIVTAPHQFEAISRGLADRIDPNSKQYQEVLNKVVLPLLRGEFDDVTGGATNFINKELQSKLGRNIPEWAAGEGQKIGRHTFYGAEGHAEGGRIERASGGKVDKSVDYLSNRLMKMAKDAKKISDKRTEPLLNAPDEAIVKALDIAQQAI